MTILAFGKGLCPARLWRRLILTKSQKSLKVAKMSTPLINGALPELNDSTNWFYLGCSRIKNHLKSFMTASIYFTLEKIGPALLVNAR